MRYGEQIFDVNVRLDGIDFMGTDLIEQMAQAFHRRHEELYTYALRDQEVVLVNARAAVIGELPALPDEPQRLPAEPAKVRGHRPIHLGGWHDVPVYAFHELARGQSINGAAVIEDPTTTIILRPGDRAITTARGWLDIRIGPPERDSS